jgi:hypothetical protein
MSTAPIRRAGCTNKAKKLYALLNDKHVRETVLEGAAATRYGYPLSQVLPAGSMSDGSPGPTLGTDEKGVRASCAEQPLHGGQISRSSGLLDQISHETP